MSEHSASEPAYSEESINRAAAVLLDPNGSLHDSIVASLHVHQWRAAHQFPIALFRHLLNTGARAVDSDSTVASRLKRVPTMVKKLARLNQRKRSKPFTLWDMQDIGGLRAIVQTPEQALALRDSLRPGGLDRRYSIARQFELIDQNDYFTRPKPSGYRSLHLVYRYIGDPKVPTGAEGLKFEVQIRSRLQHAWATSNEIVGTFRREDLKSGEGDPEWLRFFALAGSAIGRREGIAPGKNVPSQDDAFREELRELKHRLSVFDRVSAYNVTQQATKSSLAQDGRYFVVVFDLPTRRLDVAPFDAQHLDAAMANYRENERDSIKNPDREVVFVSADSLAALEDAYPNYFADTEDFLLSIYSPEEVAEIDARSAQVQMPEE